MKVEQSGPQAWLVLSAAILMLSGGTAFGQAVYKSINAQGQTVYSSEPPPRARDIEQVELPPGPTQEEVKEAREAGERISQSANQMQRERVAKEQRATSERQQAEAEAAEQAREQQVIDQLKKDETLREYYGYRDYTFPTPSVKPAGAGVTAGQGVRATPR